MTVRDYCEELRAPGARGQAAMMAAAAAACGVAVSSLYRWVQAGYCPPLGAMRMLTAVNLRRQARGVPLATADDLLALMGGSQ